VFSVVLTRRVPSASTNRPLGMPAQRRSTRRRRVRARARLAAGAALIAAAGFGASRAGPACSFPILPVCCPPLLALSWFAVVDDAPGHRLAARRPVSLHPPPCRHCRGPPLCPRANTLAQRERERERERETTGVDGGNGGKSGDSSDADLGRDVKELQQRHAHRLLLPCRLLLQTLRLPPAWIGGRQQQARLLAHRGCALSSSVFSCVRASSLSLRWSGPGRKSATAVRPKACARS